MVIIIGAGPAGLAVAAVLGRGGIPYRVLERSDRIGGAYATIDPELRLLTPRDLTSLPYVPMKAGADDRPTAAEFADYLESYRASEGIRVEPGVSVARVESRGRGFVVVDSAGTGFPADQVVVATGSFGFPKPSGIAAAKYPGVRFLEAGDWRAIRAASGRRFLIIGSGIYATELATRLSESSPVHLMARPGLRFLPLHFLGVPIHRWLMPFERLPKFFFPRICGKGWREPLIDVGVAAAIRSGKVSLCPPAADLPAGAGIEIVVNATGFRHDLSILPSEIRRNAAGEIDTLRNQSRSHPGLFILGAHCSGGIDSKYLRGIRRDALRIGKILAKQRKK